MSDDSLRLFEAVNDARVSQEPMRVVGSGSKNFLYSGNPNARLLDVSEHTGVIEYRPEELVITVRAGTTLSELQQIAGDHQQMWACDPPQFSGAGTVGGAIATGLCGPGRPWWGTMRDSLLGVELINGYGEHCRFGGKVIKNVAGFDVARLLAGSQGTLGIVLSASLKLVPAPECIRSVAISCNAAEGESMTSLFRNRTSTLSGTCYHDGTLRLRFSGVDASVAQDLNMLPSGRAEIDPEFWQDLRDHRLPFFANDEPLWRVSLPISEWYQGDATERGTTWLAEWNGSLVWCRIPSGNAPVLAIKSSSIRSFRNITHEAPVESKYASRLKNAFDPQRLFNPGVIV